MCGILAEGTPQVGRRWDAGENKKIRARFRGLVNSKASEIC